KSPDKTAVYDPDTNFIILTNHFQSHELRNDPLNVENMANETSVYRYERVSELLAGRDSLRYMEMADILRDRKGKYASNIGLGNEKAINQLIAHHSVIFQPEEKKLWISTGRFQQGDYLCYDLDSIFASKAAARHTSPFNLEEYSIPADALFGLDSLLKYDLYKEMAASVQRAIKEKDTLAGENMFAHALIDLNPEFHHTYSLLGQYYMMLGNADLAGKYFTLALSKEVSSATERKKIKEMLLECQSEN
ncbi:MAG TPA: carcinine hydrolase/isopenicillin-N N-acyltransferase family protein, partial [Bacteroidales bacterium]|nr:carcinine hydrolase/isopenicillin-N N-acyltransferase family protein [Bacteroidales bacterium]